MEFVFPVGEREVCACFENGKYACRCVYVDFEKSKVSGVIIRILVILIDWVWLADSDFIGVFREVKDGSL